jgi:hypothetical protein
MVNFFYLIQMHSRSYFINTDTKPPLCVSTITRNETLALNETSAYVVVSCVLVDPCAPLFSSFLVYVIYMIVLSSHVLPYSDTFFYRSQQQLPLGLRY